MTIKYSWGFGNEVGVPSYAVKCDTLEELLNLTFEPVQSGNFSLSGLDAYEVYSDGTFKRIGHIKGRAVIKPLNWDAELDNLGDI